MSESPSNMLSTKSNSNSEFANMRCFIISKIVYIKMSKNKIDQNLIELDRYETKLAQGLISAAISEVVRTRN